MENELQPFLSGTCCQISTTLILDQKSVICYMIQICRRECETFQRSSCQSILNSGSRFLCTFRCSLGVLASFITASWMLKIGEVLDDASKYRRTACTVRSVSYAASITIMLSSTLHHQSIRVHILLSLDLEEIDPGLGR